MQRRTFLTFGALTPLASACSSIGSGLTSLGQKMSSSGSASAPAAAASAAESSRQSGYLQLEVMNVQWDAKNVDLKDLDKPFKDQAERLSRVRDLGPRLQKAFGEGAVQAAKPRTYLVYVWASNSTPVTAMVSWERDGEEMIKSQPVEVTGEKGIKVPNFDTTVSNLGAPRIFRIKAVGAKAIMTSLQIPWAMLTEKTYIMVCSEEQATVYPGGDKGLWITSTYLSTQMVGWKYAIMAFVHDDPRPATVQEAKAATASAGQASAPPAKKSVKAVKPTAAAQAAEDRAKARAAAAPKAKAANPAASAAGAAKK